MNLVYGGMWNTTGSLFCGIGWVGIGLYLRRERRILGLFTVILGVSALVDSVGTVFAVEALHSTGLYVYLVLAIIWPAWLGIDLLRKPAQVQIS